MNPTIKPASKANSANLFETLIYLLILAGMLFFYIYTGFIVEPLADPNSMDKARLEQVVFGFGFKQFQLLPLPLLLAWLLLTLAGAFFIHTKPEAIKRLLTRLNQTLFNDKRWIYAGAGIFFLLCVLLRSHLVSEDFYNYGNFILENISTGQVHVRFDEMWESNLHFNAYIILNKLFGWDLTTSFQTLSCLAAPVFFLLAVNLCRRVLPEKALPLAALLFSGGYMQLFFGDMEYYTMSITLVLAYFYCAHLFIQRQTSFIVPAVILGLTMSFHMETIFLLPSLFFLSIIAVQRRDFLHLCSGWVGLAGMVSLTLLFFAANQVSLTNLRDVSWGLGRAGNILANFMPLKWNTTFARLNMWAIIFPLIWFLLPLLVFRRIPLNEFNGFLLSGAACGIPFALTWVVSIGYFSDWNLFSMPLFPAILLLSINLVGAVKMPLKKELFWVMLSLSALVSYSWIIGNHFL